MVEVIARITPSAPRRLFGITVLGALGLLLLTLSILQPPPGFPARLFLFAMGAGSVYAASVLSRATKRALVLTAEALSDDSGVLVARVADIRGVERGMLAFKPSNGFILRTENAQPRGWAPGLWWRLGRRIGVGGVISGAEGRAMADAISVLVQRRD
jgi:hypothetical protein